VNRFMTDTAWALRRMAKSTVDLVFEKTGRFLLTCEPNRATELIRRARLRPVDGDRWFLPEEAELVERLASLLVPTDEDTPGVSEMDVLGSPAWRIIETAVADSPRDQELYAEGLLVIDELARRIYEAKFVELSIQKQLDLMMLLDIHGHVCSTGNPLIRKIKNKLFVLLRMRDGSYPASELFSKLVQDVLGAFYTSEVSWIWLGYDGPPMPFGYPDLHVPRPRKRLTGSGAISDLLASGYGKRIPNINQKKHVTDVVVVGSGAGGAVAAKELAEAGLSVVVIEAGKRFNPFTDYPTGRSDFELLAGKVFDSDDKCRDLYTVTGSNGFFYNRVKGVGGTTLKYVACSPRFHEPDFRVRTEDGIGDDWPIRYEDLEPFYTRVEYELGVSGPTGSEANPFDPPRSRPFPTPAHRFNLASLAIKRGTDKLGLHLVREPLAIPSVDWNGRPACSNAGTCSFGCAIAAKSSMDVTYIHAAERTGKVEIRERCTAHRVMVNPDGKARGVAYFDGEGREHEIAARAVVLAGNAVETPRLLLLSSSGRFPDGLANSSGLVGKYFMEHLAVVANGLFEERMDPWRGIPTGGMLQDFYATNKANAFARGWTIYVRCGENWPLSTAKKVSGWGGAHKHRMQKLFAHSVGLSTVGEQLPDVRNQVTLDPNVKDRFGLPVPRLTNELSMNDRAMIKAIKISLTDILNAAGSVEILENDHRPGWSSHYLGTCRMGSDPKSSVVNGSGRTHDIPNLFIADGSVFVTGAAVNPAITISALAARTATFMVDAFRRGEL
jgi:choline dehydrogenase-like flavoprotein